MQTFNEGHDGTNAALASTLIRTILESRRAIRLAMSMMQEMMQTGTVIEWMEESSPARMRPVSLPGAPKLQLHQGGMYALSKKKPTPRTPLRLVSPFRHDSPLVMPGDSSFADAPEPPEEPRRERVEPERAREEPRQATESGALR